MSDSPQSAFPPAAEVPLPWDQVAQAYAWSHDVDPDAAPDAAAPFVTRFEATWGPLTAGTLLHFLQRPAPPIPPAVGESLSASSPLPGAEASKLPADRTEQQESHLATTQPAEQREDAVERQREQENSRTGDTREGRVAEVSLVVREAPLDFTRLFALTALGIAVTAWPPNRDGTPARSLYADGWAGLRSFSERPTDPMTRIVCDTLADSLHSSHPRERWISALFLGRLRDLRAVPALVGMLTEFLSLERVRTAAGYPTFFYEEWRVDVAPLLWQMGDAQLAGALRQALLVALAMEQAIPRPSGQEQEVFIRQGQEQSTRQQAFEWYATECKPWLTYQHQLVYGLGRLGAFGALVGVPTPVGIYDFWGGPHTWMDDIPDDTFNNAHAEEHADRFRGYLWRVEACCGFLEPTYGLQLGEQSMQDGTVAYSFAEAPELAQAVERLLEEQFGLSEAERYQAMRDYEAADYVPETMRWYESVARQSRP